MNDRETFAAAVTANSRAMFRAARAVLDADADAEDAVGEAVLRAWQNYGRLRDPARVKPWLMKITVNCAREQRRKYGRVTPVEDLEGLAGTVEGEPVSTLWEAVLRLPLNQRSAVVLFYYEELSEAETAKVLRVPAGTVKSRLSRARARLRELLREEDEG